MRTAKNKKKTTAQPSEQPNITAIRASVASLQPPPTLSDQLKAMFDTVKPRVSLAGELGVSSTTAWRYLNDLDEGTIREDVWARICNIAAAHGLDATRLRPMSAPRSSVDHSLLSYLDVFSTKQMADALIKILEHPHQQARDVLVLVLRDRLSRM